MKLLSLYNNSILVKCKKILIHNVDNTFRKFLHYFVFILLYPKLFTNARIMQINFRHGCTSTGISMI